MLHMPLAGEKWTVEMLGNTIKFDHGYGRESAVIGHFLRLLASLDSPDQRRFLRFVTGSPRLPPGGLAALQVSFYTAHWNLTSHGPAAGSVPLCALSHQPPPRLPPGGTCRQV